MDGVYTIIQHACLDPYVYRSFLVPLVQMRLLTKMITTT